MAAESKRSPWVYVGVGCTALLLLTVVVCVSLFALAYRKVQQVKVEMKDPAVRTARVKEILGCEELPQGYSPMITFSLPWVMDVAILSDRAPDSEGLVKGIDKSGFLYFSFVGLGRKEKAQELRDYFEGKSSDVRILRDSHINIDSDALLRRGVLEVNGQTLLYMVQRGSVQFEHDRHHGLATVMLIECTGDRRQRMGVWFGPDLTPSAAAEAADLKDTVGDEERIREFMAHFRPCHP